jgi:hypothetical protein
LLASRPWWMGLGLLLTAIVSPEPNTASKKGASEC